jgi:serine/threonine-protein kinase
VSNSNLTRIETLFHECLALPAAERQALLTKGCAGDEDLRREVESLLAADLAGTRAAHALGQAAMGALGPSTPWIGRLVGAYRIEREVGHGGMGTVYLAVRADGHFDKQVAVKVLRWGLGTPMIDRFRMERQILASLEHPNIARLLDGGMTDDGSPYLVMEYVDGEPLTAWCDRCKLPVRDRLKLFQQICAAMQFAHQHLVVHRDLKPDNVLVDRTATPKLLDFGVAKIVSEQLQDVALTDCRPLTPRYASPEQVQGKPVSTATDVYGLGVILYELLTGIPAHGLTEGGLEELLRVVCTEDPARPSAAVLQQRMEHPDVALCRAAERGVTPERLVGDLSGDLDAIVMKALRKEPPARYGSAEQLSADVQRYLESRPVLARRHTLRYRIGRFIRRKRAAVAVAAVLLIAFVTFFAVAGLQAIKIARERDKADRIADFLASVFSHSDPDTARGKNVTARQILDNAAERIDRELSREPEVQARMAVIIGDVYRTLGVLDRALPLAQSGLRIQRDVLHYSPIELAVGKLVLARVHAERGEAAAAEKLFEEVIALRAQLLRSDPAQLASALNGLGSLYQGRGNSTAAEPLHRESIEIRRRTGGSDADIANNLNNLGLVLIDLKRYPEAADRLNEALGIYRRTVGDVHQGVASCLNNLAILRRRQGDLEGAIACYREALDVRIKLHGDLNPSTALVMTNLGSALSDAGYMAEAETLARRGLEIRRKLLPEGHIGIGHSEALLGRLLLDRGNTHEAEPLLRNSVRIFGILPEGNQIRTDAEAALGRCLARMHRYSEAHVLLARSCPAMAHQRGPTDRRTVLCAQALADSSLAPHASR